MNPRPLLSRRPRLRSVVSAPLRAPVRVAASHASITLAVFAALVAPMGMLTGCTDDKLVAGGTGTSTGNTVTAQVLTLDGTGAGGARVVLRPTDYLPDSIGGNAQVTLADAVADSAGRFSVQVKPGVDYLLECSQVRNGDTDVAWVEHVHLDAGATEDLGKVLLAQAAAVSGVAMPAAADQDANQDPNQNVGKAEGLATWAGFPGTTDFVRIGADHRYALGGFPSGQRELAIVRRRKDGTLQRAGIRGWTAMPGQAMVMDSITLPPSASKDTALAALACKDSVSSISEYEYAGPPAGGADRVLRSILTTTPPQWIEIDPCQGSWRKLRDLPAAAADANGAFTDTAADYIQVGKFMKFYRIGSAGLDSGAVLSPPALVAHNDYAAGRYYSLASSDSVLRIYAGLSITGLNKPVDSLIIAQPSSGFAGLAVNGSLMYLLDLHIGAPPGVYEFDLAKRATMSFYLPLAEMNSGIAVGPGNTTDGFASSKSGGLWFLDQNRLYEYHPGDTAFSRSISVNAPAPLLLLTRTH